MEEIILDLEIKVINITVLTFKYNDKHNIDNFICEGKFSVILIIL